MAVRARRAGGARAALALGACAAVAAFLPAACLYPDYTFDELAPTGGGSSTENCLNGVDDDSDGLVDCADDACGGAGYACVATAPLGWTGYLSLYVGPDGEAPACPAQFPSAIPYVGRSTPTADPAACATCACGAPMGGVCDLADVIIVSEKTCQSIDPPAFATNLSVPAAWDGKCESMGSAPGGLTTCGGFCNRTVKAAAPQLVGGACAVSGGEATKPEVKWATLGKACGDAPSGGGCTGGQVCQPTPATGFESGLCNYKPGEQACPGEPFTEQHVFYEGVEDTRMCTECSCGSPVNATCAATITVFTDNACTTGAVSFSAGSCALLPGNPTITGRSAMITSMSPCACQPSGGESMGAVTATQPTTFCCVP